MNTRIDLAEKIEDVMLYVLAYLSVADSAELSDVELRREAKDKLLYVIAKHTKVDSYLEKHIDKLIDEVIDVTERRMKDESGGDDGGSSYWTSRDRAMLIAENEANSFENYIEYREAATSGRTKKVWLTENDNKVRTTHELAEGQTVDIDGLFLVGDSLMRFPMDTEYGADPREIVNCRCACRYE